MVNRHDLLVNHFGEFSREGPDAGFENRFICKGKGFDPSALRQFGPIV